MLLLFVCWAVQAQQVTDVSFTLVNDSLAIHYNLDSKADICVRVSVDGIHYTPPLRGLEGAVGQNLVEQYENSEVQVGKIKQVWDDSIKDYIKEYSATIVLPKDTVDQLRGHLEVTATDMAGLTSNIKTDDGRVIVVDTIAPTRTVNFALENEGGNHQEVGGVHYFSDNVKFEIKVDETNFRSNLVKVTVEKDGESKTQKLNWTKSSDSSVNSAALTLYISEDHY